jgi:hypothetical protein
VVVDGDGDGNRDEARHAWRQRREAADGRTCSAFRSLAFADAPSAVAVAVHVNDYVNDDDYGP